MFLHAGGFICYIYMFPSYYVNGRDTSLEDFLDPEVLDTLALKINEVLEVIMCGGSGFIDGHLSV